MTPSLKGTVIWTFFRTLDALDLNPAIQRSVVVCIKRGPNQGAPRTIVLDNMTRSVGLERDLLQNPPVHICRARARLPPRGGNDAMLHIRLLSTPGYQNAALDRDEPRSTDSARLGPVFGHL